MEYEDAQLIPVIKEITEDVEALAGGSGTNRGTGGMITKLEAAKICLSCGCDMIICNGSEPENLYAIMDGKAVGTTFTEK